MASCSRLARCYITLVAAVNAITKSTGERDPKIYQNDKCNQRFHSTNVHIGVKADFALVRILIGNEANVDGVTQRRAAAQSRVRGVC